LKYQGNEKKEFVSRWNPVAIGQKVCFAYTRFMPKLKCLATQAIRFHDQVNIKYNNGLSGDFISIFSGQFGRDIPRIRKMD